MKRVALLICLVLASVTLGWFLGNRGILIPSSGQASSSGSQAAPASRGPSKSAPDAVRGPVALGRLEPFGKVIDINAMPGDRLDSLAVDENAEVRKDAPLAYLDSRSLRELEYQAVRNQRLEGELRRTAEEKLADARVAAAKVALNQARAYDLDLKVQQSKIAVIQKNLDNARLDQRRLKDLSEIVSAQDREQQDLAVAKAEAELKAAQALYDKGKTSGKLGVEAAEADLAAAEAAKTQVLSTLAVESLKKREELAKSQWDRTVLRAPCDGTVLKVFVRPGESIGPAPILQLADRRRMIVLAEVYEADVTRLRVGQQAKVISRAFPGTHGKSGLTGKVARIGKTISRPELRPLDPMAPADRHVIDVRVDLDDEGSKVAAEFIHLQVEVQFAAASP